MSSASGPADSGSQTGLTVADVVRDVIAEVAPSESALVDGLRGMDDDLAVRRLTRKRKRREPLGFGLDEIAVLLTPVAWVALDEAVRHSVGATVDGAARRVGKRLRAWRRGGSEPRTVPPLSREQITEVRRRVLELSEQNGVEREQAEVLADRLVARLMLDTDSNSDSPDSQR